MRTTKTLFSLLCVLLCGCASSRTAQSENVNTEQHDSVSVETVIVYVPDTVYIEIPAQTSERTTADSISRLDNDYAISEARINPDGSLFHSLRTKPQKKPVQIQKPVERHSNIVYRTKTVTETEYVEVPCKLTWWETTRLQSWNLIAAALIICIVWIYRKPIINFIKTHFL